MSHLHAPSPLTPRLLRTPPPCTLSPHKPFPSHPASNRAPSPPTCHLHHHALPPACRQAAACAHAWGGASGLQRAPVFTLTYARASHHALASHHVRCSHHALSPHRALASQHCAITGHAR
eukprot:360905-Chlamydomonas_euryale.AAC.4